jgi:hypothetical protein
MDDAMKCWPCAPKPMSAPSRPTAASGAQTCTVDDDPEAVVAISRWRGRHSLEAFQAAEGGSHPVRVRDVLTDMPVTRQYNAGWVAVQQGCGRRVAGHKW